MRSDFRKKGRRKRLKDDVEKAIRVANYIKDQAKKLKGKVKTIAVLKLPLS